MRRLQDLHNREAEIALLGTLCIDPGDYWPLVRDLVGADDFYDNRNRVIFMAIAALGARAEPLDCITIVEEVERQGIHQTAAGGASYVAWLADQVPYPWHPVAWAKIVHDLAERRRMVERAENPRALDASRPRSTGIRLRGKE